jgi:DNA-directed RNA polymerase subunit RPC12/RpoP
MIMNIIQRIGGDEYEEITFDKNKVIDALSKAIAKKPNDTERTVSGKIVLSCSECGKWLYIPEIEKSHKPNYCNRCGQKIDWPEVTDDERV